MTDDEPKPNRGMWLNRTCWGLTATLGILGALLALDYLEWIDTEAWGRKVRVAIHGRDHYRQQVEPGMTRPEVEVRIGEGKKEKQEFRTVCVLYSREGLEKIGRGEKPPPEWHYRTPWTRVAYPGFGFGVVYHCPGEDRSAWTVLAVVDGE